MDWLFENAPLVVTAMVALTALFVAVIASSRASELAADVSELDRRLTKCVDNGVSASMFEIHRKWRDSEIGVLRAEIRRLQRPWYQRVVARWMRLDY